MKSLKNLLIPFFIMVLLLAGVVVYFVWTSAKESSVSNDSAVVNALYIDISEVKAITVTSSDSTEIDFCLLFSCFVEIKTL